MNKSEQESRTYDQLKDQYEIEKELAERLRNAGKEERKHLYTALYDEYFRRVPHHPQITQKSDPNIRRERINRSVGLLKHFLHSQSVYLEVGPGDCALALDVSNFVKKVYAVDVSQEITKDLNMPENFELIITDGSSIPVPPGSIDLAYSNQLMEHLHPEDALEQIIKFIQGINTWGKYICVTPNRVSGPHDISKYFDNVARGFHLKEYTTTELVKLFKSAGFTKVVRFINIKGFKIELPIFPADYTERALMSFPHSVRARLSRGFFIRLLLGGSNIKLIATK